LVKVKYLFYEKYLQNLSNTHQVHLVFLSTNHLLQLLLHHDLLINVLQIEGIYCAAIF